MDVLLQIGEFNTRLQLPPLDGLLPFRCHQRKGSQGRPDGKSENVSNPLINRVSQFSVFLIDG